jgi:16S rRNA (adenine1518-N6/adenine1519-N6)-dimethyltransferase
VDSALVRLDVRDQPAVDVPDIDAFFRLVEAVFQYRRKQLGGALGRIAGVGSTEAAKRLRELGIDPERRPQTLNLSEWEGVNRVFGR